MTDQARQQAISAASMLHTAVCQRFGAGVMRLGDNGERNVFLSTDEMLAFNAAMRLLNVTVDDAYEDVVNRRK